MKAWPRRRTIVRSLAVGFAALAAGPLAANAQPTRADYERAMGLRDAYHPEFYKVAVSAVGSTTTAWTRSGGMSSGWDGRSVRTTPNRRTS